MLKNYKFGVVISVTEAFRDRNKTESGGERGEDYMRITGNCTSSPVSSTSISSTFFASMLTFALAAAACAADRPRRIVDLCHLFVRLCLRSQHLLIHRHKLSRARERVRWGRWGCHSRDHHVVAREFSECFKLARLKYLKRLRLQEHGIVCVGKNDEVLKVFEGDGRMEGGATERLERFVECVSP